MSLELKLENIYQELKYLKDNLSKLGPKRRIGSNFEKKISDAKIVYKRFKEILTCLPEGASKKLILLCSAIDECYCKILLFEEEVNFVLCGTNSSKLESDNMSGEKFCLKTAVSLLPKMTGEEQVTKELIDAIELYDSMLSDDGKKLLVNFVLKSRLTSGAKMRLATSYSSVDLLLKDMHTHLLTRKSDTALQSQLQKIKQGDRSVKEFGEEIEKLFVDLTISQANGDQAAYKVLQPINEKNAIKCFSDGLRSQRIGTIIAARNLNALKDAMRVAEDETNSFSNQQVFSYNRRSRGRHNSFNYSSRGHRGNNWYRPMSQYRQQGTWQGSGTRGASSYGAAGHARGADASTRGTRYVRGNRSNYVNRGNFANRSNYRTLNHFTTNEHVGNDSKEEENQELDEFFRT